MELLTKAIYSQPNISGFTWEQRSHKINLFADNVILLLTKPNISLQIAHQILMIFSTLSYYKVNFSKSLLLDLEVDQTSKVLLQQSLLYMWNDIGISHFDNTDN